MRVQRLGRALVFASLGLIALSGSLAAAEQRKPNIVIIVADDLGYGDLGFQGGKDIPTPHLDRLSKTGVTCSNGYVSGPYCSPTRAGLLTGRYQQRFGHEFNPGQERAGGAGFGLPLSEKTLPKLLKDAGYVTGLVGKWHLGSLPAYRPNQRGFDEFYGFLGGAHTYFASASKNIYRNNEVVKEDAYLTDAIAREASGFIDRHKGRPFFLEVTFNAVHTPMDAQTERLARFAHLKDKSRQKYAAMLSALDDAVRAILGRLEAAGLSEQTLIFFISDNGGPTMLGTSVNGSTNTPLRGSKRTTLEGGIRVPFVIQWKGHLPAGSVYSSPVIQLDILPTALAAAGVSVPSDLRLDGVNLLPHLTGKDTRAPHDRLYWRLGAQNAIRQSDWKLVQYDKAVDQPGVRSVAGNNNNANVTAPRLYNLASDIGETKDLSATEPKKVEELLQAWKAWERELSPPLWGPGNARAATAAAKKRE